MLIDFHTHIFPDSIAERAIRSLKQGMINRHGFALPAYLDGTLDCLVSTMAAEDVDISVIMPIATRPGQAAGINRFALSARSEKILAFGPVHPIQEDWEKTLEDVKAAGFPGIKLHPEFQRCYMDSPESVRVLKKAAELGLIVLIHAGEDVGVFPPVHSTPQRIRRALDAAPDVTLVAAHMGGYNMWEDAARFLGDAPVFFDTAYVNTSLEKDVFRDLVSRFGSWRVLFGSDSPWALARTHTLSYISDCGLDQTAMDDITHKNAQRLLGIDR